MEKTFRHYAYLNWETGDLRVTRKAHRPRAGEVRVRLEIVVDTPADREYVLSAHVAIPIPEVTQMTMEPEEAGQ